ncbi:hypothetical protein OIU85_028852 [Salix viminalis]|uniref:Uncharacterized protein n=1 Tax=Salix viminalis TaxID=40686 RepID=A0A9Q0QA32_SALVM|nr:hypothetical protein OIU85_028852 [Salix viminalis]
MATSLEELLAKEGFRGGRSGTRARPLFKAEAASMPRCPSGDQGKRDSPLGPSMRRIKTERTSSDVTRYTLRGESPGSNSSSSRRRRDDLVKKERNDSRLKTEHGGRGSKDVEEDKTVKVETLEGVKGREIVEAGVEENDTFKDKHSDRVYYSERTERGPKGNGRKNLAMTTGEVWTSLGWFMKVRLEAQRLAMALKMIRDQRMRKGHQQFLKLLLMKLLLKL